MIVARLRHSKLRKMKLFPQIHVTLATCPDARGQHYQPTGHIPMLNQVLGGGRRLACLDRYARQMADGAQVQIAPLQKYTVVPLVILVTVLLS